MKAKKITLIILIIVIAVIIVGWLVWKLFLAPVTFHAVYLTTGDLYFGQLAQFPSFGLKQPYTIQVDTQNQEAPLSVQRFSSVFWGPGDFMKINRENVVWVVELASQGQLAQLLRNNPDLLPSAPPVQQALPDSGSTE